MNELIEAGVHLREMAIIFAHALPRGTLGLTRRGRGREGAGSHWPKPQGGFLGSDPIGAGSGTKQPETATAANCNQNRRTLFQIKKMK